MVLRDSPFHSESGMVLMSSLAILFGVMLVGLGAWTMLQNDLRVSANLRGSTEAFYYSSAGLEWGKRAIARADNFPPVPPSQTSAFSTGTFSVSFQSPIVVGPLSARINIRSVGAHGTAKHLIEAQVTKSYDLADAALVLRGNGMRIDVSAPGTVISGADHDATGTRNPDSAAARSAVSVGNASLGNLVSGALEGFPNVLDRGAGTEVLRQSDYLSTAFMNEFVHDLCASSEASVHAIPTTGTLAVEDQVWGTSAAPQLHCVEGRIDPGDGVTFGGAVIGAGILVVRNSELVLNGTFRWDGLVIVTGSDVSFKTVGGSPKQILGAVVVNETGIPGVERNLLDFQGAIRLGFSRSILNRTVSLFPSAVLSAARDALPAIIMQNYWRADAG